MMKIGTIHILLRVICINPNYWGVPTPLRNEYRIRPTESTPSFIHHQTQPSLMIYPALYFGHIIVHQHSLILYKSQIKKALYCLDLIKYAYEKLKDLERELDMDLWVTHSHTYALSKTKG